MYENLLHQSLDRTILAHSTAATGIMGVVTSIVLGTLGATALAAIGRKVFKKKFRPREDTPMEREAARRKEAKRAEKAAKKSGRGGGLGDGDTQERQGEMTQV
jgi:hypothetical protein